MPTYGHAPLPCARRHGYFRSLPEREYLPVFWSPGELALLKGTDLGDAIQEELECVRSDYAEQIEPLIAKHGLEGMHYSFPAFQAAASLVASRAFKVDDDVGARSAAGVPPCKHFLPSPRPMGVMNNNTKSPSFT